MQCAHAKRLNPIRSLWHINAHINPITLFGVHVNTTFGFYNQNEFIRMEAKSVHVNVATYSPGSKNQKAVFSRIITLTTIIIFQNPPQPWLWAPSSVLWMIRSQKPLTLNLLCWGVQKVKTYVPSALRLTLLDSFIHLWALDNKVDSKHSRSSKIAIGGPTWLGKSPNLTRAVESVPFPKLPDTYLKKNWFHYPSPPGCDGSPFFTLTYLHPCSRG